MANKVNKLSIATKKKPIQLTIKPTNEIKSERIYSNYVHVSASSYDFQLTFCDIQTPLQNPTQNEIKAAIQTQIVIPLQLVDPLIDAINNAKLKMGKLSDGKSQKK